MKNLPLPDYTRPDGVLNLASRVPLNAKRPDLGPRIECAYRSLDSSDFGTTKLHIDAVDTLSVLASTSNFQNKPVSQTNSWSALYGFEPAKFD